jgi:hypothetical protein
MALSSGSANASGFDVATARYCSGNSSRAVSMPGVTNGFLRRSPDIAGAIAAEARFHKHRVRGVSGQFRKRNGERWADEAVKSLRWLSGEPVFDEGRVDAAGDGRPRIHQDTIEVKEDAILTGI